MPPLYTWRAATAADLPAIHALKDWVMRADSEPPVPALEDLQRQFNDPWSRPATDSRVAVAPDGAVAAFGRVVANPLPEGPARAYLSDDIHPQHRGQGLDDALLDWLVARAAAKLAETYPADHPGPRQASVHTSDFLTGRVRTYQRHGFAPSFSLSRLRLPLTGALPTHPLPAGYTLTTYQPEYDEATRVAQNEVFAEDPLQDQISPDDWRAYFIQSAAARLDLTFIILKDGEVAAYAINRVHAAENTRPGHTTAWVHTLGVRRPWRRQGLAAALMSATLAAFRAAGFDYATLEVEGTNSAAQQLYAGLGFTQFNRSTEYVKILK